MKKFNLFAIIAYIVPLMILAADPQVSIITSLYKADAFIDGFLKDITQQTIFSSHCELLIIDAHSPDNEYSAIKPYLEKYPNITYIRLPDTPSLYNVWNLAISTYAQGEYIVNANADDRLCYDALEILYTCFLSDPQLDVAYGGLYLSNKRNETFDQCKTRNARYIMRPEMTKSTWRKAFGSNHTMFKKSCFNTFGLFDESYTVWGDYEILLRIFQKNGRLKSIRQPLGVFYINPGGISADKPLNRKEFARIIETYEKLFSP